MSNLSSFLGGGTNKATAITASGSFAQPNNVQFVTAMLVGGGCGGYAFTGGTACGAGGGGGGAIAFYDYIYLTGSLTVSIGVGGTGGTAAAVPAGAGGDTTITSNHPGSPTFTAQGNLATTRISVGEARYGYIGQHNLGGGNYYTYASVAIPAPVPVARGGISFPTTSTPYAYGGQMNHPFYGGGYGGNGSYSANTGYAGQYSGLGVVGGAGGAAGVGYAGGGGGAGIGAGGAGGTALSAGIGTDGVAAAANTGGGGGGGSLTNTSVAKNGGAGGTGYAMIFYVG